MRILVLAIALLTMITACSQAPVPQTATLVAPTIKPPRAVPSLDVDSEAARLHAALVREVPSAIVDTPATEQGWIERSRAVIAASNERIDRPQLLVVVDRGPGVQQMRIVVARPDAAWRSLGGTEVSTGEMGRRDYYLTPTGVFLHTNAILDWRAQGTFNTQHIRGLGLKGMRVWDFGWQVATKGWGTEEQGEIRLLMHATDPTYLETRIGRPASKGCVRIPATMNRFLDRHGILDVDYERAAKDERRFEALLLPDRSPTPLAGDMLVVVDSSEPLRPGA